MISKIICKRPEIMLTLKPGEDYGADMKTWSNAIPRNVLRFSIFLHVYRTSPAVVALFYPEGINADEVCNTDSRLQVL